MDIRAPVMDLPVENKIVHSERGCTVLLLLSMGLRSFHDFNVVPWEKGS